MNRLASRSLCAFGFLLSAFLASCALHEYAHCASGTLNNQPGPCTIRLDWGGLHASKGLESDHAWILPAQFLGLGAFALWMGAWIARPAKTMEKTP